VALFLADVLMMITAGEANENPKPLLMLHVSTSTMMIGVA
jgi:hypothetical protein